MLIWILLFAPAASFLLTGLLYRYALAAQLLDMPNARSSHAVPTARGGGLAIVAVVLIELALLWNREVLPINYFLALGMGGTAVATVGWWDDISDLRARWRLLTHLMAAILVVLMVEGSLRLPLLGLDLTLGLFGSVMLVLFIAWVVNLYNFMDGIDGIAVVEAVSVAGVGALLLLWVDAFPWAFISGAVAFASLGFLAWNWPPAKIFMGDAGSGFLGFILAAIAVLTWAATPLTIWPWLILLGAFIVDASVTLVRRAVSGDRIYEAHRSHAYQNAARQIGTHKPVTVGVLFINIFWLAPWAAAATIWPTWGALFVVIAWSPLLVLCLRLRAGLPE